MLRRVVDKITIRHVLTHTSGIANFTSFPDYPKLEPFAATTAQLVARFRDKALDFEPGEKWNYSNSGYVLLTYLIEKISGGSYEAFVRENIFKPLKMSDTGAGFQLGCDSTSSLGLRVGAGSLRKMQASIHMSIPQGAGALMVFPPLRIF